MINKNSNYFDFIVGTFVILCAGLFFLNSFKSTKINSNGGYYLTAKFENINGINSGSDVKMAGVKIGTVTEQFIDEKTYRATLKFTINNKIKLSSDSSAKIASDGLLGSKFLEINPGSQDDFLAEGDELVFTQSSVNFEDLLARFMFSDKKKNE